MVESDERVPWARGKALQAVVVPVLLLVHLSLLAYGGWCHSPCWDEVGHFAAGIHHWQSGEYHLYRVNPPLVRMWATLPASLMLPPLEIPTDDTVDRGEFVVGPLLIRELGPARTQWAFAVARWACLPFSVLGAVVCWQWARQLYGDWTALIAISLWCFDPNILANAQMITPDTGATAFGLLSCYLLWEWCRKPHWEMALLVGLATGLALLCKFTWVSLAVIYLTMWFCQLGLKSLRRDEWSRFLRHGSLSILFALLVVNAGYRFQGTCKPLGEFAFRSKALSGQHPENRFRDSVLGRIPVPLPDEFLLGIDRQRVDFESGFPSYLRGEWRRGGWWYYYLYGLAIKTPIGTLLLLALASFRSRRISRLELSAVIPGVILLAFVSSQTGFNHHLRYVLPTLPFLFLFASRVSVSWTGSRLRGFSIAAAFTLLAIVESLSVYPHSLSFFNLAIGGPRQGHLHLLDSNVEWGQDLYFLRQWLERHPEARPAWSANWGIVDPIDLGCPTAGWPPSGFSDDPKFDKTKLGPLPGWYAVGMICLHLDDSPDRENAMRQKIPLCGYLNHFEPVDRIGFSMLIYHLTPEAVAPVRRKLGLPPCQGSDTSEARNGKR